MSGTVIAGIRIARGVKDKNEYSRRAAAEEFPLMMLSGAEADDVEKNVNAYARQMKLHELLVSLARYSEKYERESIKADEHGYTELPVMYIRSDFRHFRDQPPRIVPSKPVDTHALNILYKDIHAVKKHLVHNGESLYSDTSPYDMNLVIDLHELYKMGNVGFYGSKFIVRDSGQTEGPEVTELYESLYDILRKAFDSVKRLDVDDAETPLQKRWNKFLRGDILNEGPSWPGKTVAYCLSVPRRMSFRAKTVVKMLPVIFRFYPWDWRYNIKFLTESLKFTLREIQKGHEIPSARYLRCRAMEYVIDILEHEDFGGKLSLDYSKLKWSFETEMVDDSDPAQRERAHVSLILEDIELGLAFEIISKDTFGWWD